MKNIIYKNTVFFVFLFCSGILFGQKKFDTNINSNNLSLNGISLSGYKTTFDFSREDVRKGWWKYARKFGNPLDMRTHYIVTIPSSSTDGNVDLKIYAQASEESGMTGFSIGIRDEKYLIQIEELLKDFKKDYYIQYYLRELKIKELEAEKIADRYAAAIPDTEKKEHLDALNFNKGETEALKERIREIERQ